MAMNISDKKIDKEIERIRNHLVQIGITNASKTDAVRFLLGMKSQGKKTNKKWKRLF